MVGMLDTALSGTRDARPNSPRHIGDSFIRKVSLWARQVQLQYSVPKSHGHQCHGARRRLRNFRIVIVAEVVLVTVGKRIRCQDESGRERRLRGVRGESSEQGSVTFRNKNGNTR